MIGRRTVLGGLAGAAALALLPEKATGNQAKERESLGRAIRALERESGGRLGVSVRDTAGENAFSWRGGDRFALCSTFKFLLAAATLARVDRGLERMDRLIPIAAADLVAHSPFAEGRVGTGATVAALCRATLQQSDNAAANLLLAPLGGPEGLTRWLRTAGDPVTRLDRIEPFMNDVKGGDPRDTTTPDAMVAHLDRFLLGDTLAPASRAQLLAWMNGNLTGDGRIRAGVPEGWAVADKTGTSGQGNYNDVALIQPPGRAPILLAIYLADTPLGWDAAEAIHADVTRVVLRNL